MITKLCENEFIPAKEHIFITAQKMWITSSPAPFPTSMQGDKFLL
jgi:hypothetical protein